MMLSRFLNKNYAGFYVKNRYFNKILCNVVCEIV